ncbi:metallopeptidase TldD-related protein [Rhodococcus sp. SBT000017]|uniref:metallopeptidase TldD-related protein n=1 Tax=unclassified Rhodococcus (in: high G+C Gram-positive bacteria) TaxID=192944 RepID=UPI000EF87612|nr:metallopeptidase TldD-related protein [Rhodococcus sp. SBT000017]RMB75815.1 TldD/PmbA family protein [Rhodococcus sp. SBT000017]
MIAPQLVIERALACASVDDTIVIVTDSSDATLRWAGNSMTTNGIATSRRWEVISIVRGADTVRVGTVSSTSVDPEDIAAVVRASEAAARSAEPAEDAMPLLPPDSVGAASGSENWDRTAAHTSIDVFGSLATELNVGFDGDDTLYGFAQHTVDNVWLGTSTGVRRTFTQPTGSVEINGKRSGASAWVGTGTTDFQDVSAGTMLAELSTRLGWARNTVELPAGRYQTLLPPSAVADLMIYLMWTMEGRGAQEGRTALSRAGGTRVGEKLTDLPLTLYSDPRVSGLEYAPFVVAGSSSDSVSVFDNGMDIERVDWVRDGSVAALSYPRAAAQKFDAPVAVPGNNLVMTGGTDIRLDEMVAATERGLLLTTLWYIREVDPTSLLLTGLTRDGVYAIENGRITGAVNNFRFNESPLDLLRRVTEAGATEATLPREWKDWFTRTAMPPLRIPDFHMSSVSAAQ